MYERILVTLDGSETAETILPFVERVAGPVDAEVILVRVVPPLSPGELVATAGVMAPDTLRLRELEAREYLDTIQSRLRDKMIRARSEVRIGSPPAEILATATAVDADVIAMATRARGTLGRLLFGSVAEAVLREAPLPVLLVRGYTGVR
jgi:nucleotide-binding universal stress UspA family protein